MNSSTSGTDRSEQIVTGAEVVFTIISAIGIVVMVFVIGLFLWWQAYGYAVLNLAPLAFFIYSYWNASTIIREDLDDD